MVCLRTQTQEGIVRSCDAASDDLTGRQAAEAARRFRRPRRDHAAGPFVSVLKVSEESMDKVEHIADLKNEVEAQLLDAELTDHGSTRRVDHE